MFFRPHVAPFVFFAPFTIKIALPPTLRNTGVEQYFSTEVPRNLRVPRVAARGSVETDRKCLGQNSQSQFYVIEEI